MNIPLINEGKSKDVNLQVVGHGNTRILTDHVQKNSLDIAADITKYVENKSPILNVVCGHKECGHKERELSHTSTPLIHPI